MCDYLEPEDNFSSSCLSDKKWSKGVRGAHVLLYLHGHLMHHCVDDQECGVLSSPLCCNVSVQSHKTSWPTHFQQAMRPEVRVWIP